MRATGWVVIGLLAAASHAAIGQSRDPGAPAGGQAKGTGVIAGVVIAADSGRPARRARLTLSGTTPSINKAVTADDQGAFSFDALPPGAYTLTATKSGMLDSVYGQRTPGSGRPGTAIQLAAGQRLDRVRLMMARGGVISGTVLDEFGDPAYGTSVRASRYTFRGGTRTLVSAGTASTDDRGIYRLTALPPGDYIVTAQARESASSEVLRLAEVKMRLEFVRAVGEVTIDRSMAAPEPAADPVDAYAVSYYPGSSAGTSAGEVPLGIGEDKAGIDMQLRRVPVSTISGMVVSTDGPLAPETGVQLLDRSQIIPSLGIRSTTARADGRFVFTGVPPGQYSLTVFGRSGGETPMHVTIENPTVMYREQLATTIRKSTAGPSQWATADVTTSGRPVEGVLLTLQRGMTMAGSLAFEGGAPPADLSRVQVRATMADSNDTTLAFEQPAAPPGSVDADGKFLVQGIMPGRYRITVSGIGQGFTMKSAIAAGRDILDFPLEVKPGEDVSGVVVSFSDKATELGGTLTDPSGAPAAEHTIVVFAADSRYWTPQSRRILSARPATDGRFSFRGLPPGDYRLAALTDVEPGQWLQPEFLKQVVAASVPVTLNEGEKKTQDLRVAK